MNAPAADNTDSAEGVAENVTSAADTPGNATGEEAQKPDPLKPKGRKVAHPKRRYAPRIKGIARRRYVLGQSKMRENLTAAKMNARSILSARQRTSQNYMVRATERATKTLAAVGEGTECPECHKFFS